MSLTFVVLARRTNLAHYVKTSPLAYCILSDLRIFQ
jgi:hypothetical protein